MKPADRYDWIVQYLEDKAKALCTISESVDILDMTFVDSYLNVTGAKFKIHYFGAFTCPQLGRDLTEMYKLGKLTRRTASIGGGLCGQGFPRWVYSYRLPRKAQSNE